MKMVCAYLGCAAMLFAGGCGNSTGNPPASHSAEGDGTGTTAQASPPVSSTGSPTTPAQSLLTHPTPRPPNVSAQFDFVGGAGPGPCLAMGSPPQVRVLVEPFPGASGSTAEGFNDQGIATYGQPVDVCFDGMGRGPISVTASGPRGFAMSGVLPPLPANSSYHYKNEWTSFDWVPAIEPSWPQGSYLITARTGTIRQSHTLTLVAPQEPGLRVLGPSTDPGHNSVPPDSRAKLFLTGFKGNSGVRLSVYRITNLGTPAPFFSAASVPIPASGNTVVEIPTTPNEGGEGEEPTFIITTRSREKTLMAPFSVVKGRETWPNVIVGPLPGS